jgi:hypothetical protein
VLAAVEGAVPAIVDLETFEKAHSLLRQRKEAKPRNTNRSSSEHLLTTIGTCKCGGPLGAIKDRYGTVYYRCQRKQQGWGCPVNSVAFRGAPAEERVVASLKEKFAGNRKVVALRILREQFTSSSRR